MKISSTPLKVSQPKFYESHHFLANSQNIQMENIAFDTFRPTRKCLHSICTDFTHYAMNINRNAIAKVLLQQETENNKIAPTSTGIYL